MLTQLISNNLQSNAKDLQTSNSIFSVKKIHINASKNDYSLL
jgi:hypothetical protein